MSKMDNASDCIGGVDELKRDDAIGMALEELKKANAVLGELSEKYSFNIAPTLEKAIAYGAGHVEKNDTHGAQSFQWIVEYNTVVSFLQIAYDYTLKAQKVLNEVDR